MGTSYLAIAPEILLVLGAVIVLMVDVFTNPSSRVHAWIVSVTLLAVAAAIVGQWDRVTTDGLSGAWGGTIRDASAQPVGFASDPAGRDGPRE